MAQRPMMMIEADWEFTLPENDSLTLAVFNAEGKQVDVLMTDKLYSSGIYTFTFSYKTNRLPNGVNSNPASRLAWRIRYSEKK